MICKTVHYNNIIMSAIAFKITGVMSVYSAVRFGADQRKFQISVSLAFARGIHRRPVNSHHKGPVTRRMFPFVDVIITVVLCEIRCRHFMLNDFANNTI